MLKIKFLIPLGTLISSNIFLSSCVFNKNVFRFDDNSSFETQKNPPEPLQPSLKAEFQSEEDNQGFFGFDDAFEYFLISETTPIALKNWNKRKNEFLENRNWVKTKLDYRDNDYVNELKNEEIQQTNQDDTFELSIEQITKDAQIKKFNYEHIWFNKSISDLQYFVLFAIKGEQLAYLQQEIINSLIDYKQQTNQSNFNKLIELFIRFINSENYALFSNTYNEFIEFFDFDNFDYKKNVKSLYAFLIDQKTKNDFKALEDKQLFEQIKIFIAQQLSIKILQTHFNEVNFDLLVHKPPIKERKSNNDQ
ncbi:Uncharacterised protein [Mycoplasmopsis citelli]|uniref:Lipoprotein n=1 Tax=Mycoplasmopsis citelli TaxID=171281 RepID=A0A449B0Q6_9BACT|nr:hypothetical protein [Mycoplasmopsis citelli]VEU74180.1 Uncharacterised protein [Mycoplasmopsis citelli]